MHQGNHFLNRLSNSRTDVENFKKTKIRFFFLVFFLLSEKVFKTRKMRLSKIFNMNIISNTSSIWSRIVITKNRNFFNLIFGYPEEKWKQVCRDSLWIFSKESRTMSTNWIKISKHYRTKLFVHNHIFEDILHHKFGCSIRIGRIDTIGLGEWRNIFFCIINSCWWGEKNIFQSNIIHHLKEIDRSHDIVFIVEERIMTTLSYCLFCCEVDHSNKFMLFKDFFEQICISHISLIQRQLISEQRKKSVLNLIFVCIWEIIEKDWLISCLCKNKRCMRPNIS